MPTDPKQIESVSKAIDKKLKDFKQNQELAVEKLGALKRAVTDMHQIRDSHHTKSSKVLADFNSMIEEIAKQKKTIDKMLSGLVRLETEAKDTKKYDMAFRKYTDAMKQHDQIKEEWQEAHRELDKDKKDPNKKKKVELLTKTLDKFGTEAGKLYDECQKILPTDNVEGILACIQPLNVLLEEYRQMMAQLLTALDSDVFRRTNTLSAWRAKVEHMKFD